MTIAELVKQPDKAMIVQPVIAKVTKVDARKTGDGRYGPWSVQHLLLEDVTGKIRCACWGRVDLASLANQTVLIGAKKGDKGWSGCSVKDNTFTATKGPNAGKTQTVKQIDLQDNGYLEITGQGEQPTPPLPVTDTSIPPSGPENYGKTAAMFLGKPAPTPQMALSGAISFWDYLQTMELVHGSALALEPNDGQARAALVNTAMIAIVGGKLCLPPNAPREPGQDGDENEDPFKD